MGAFVPGFPGPRPTGVGAESVGAFSLEATLLLNGVSDSFSLKGLELLWANVKNPINIKIIHNIFFIACVLLKNPYHDTSQLCYILK